MENTVNILLHCAFRAKKIQYELMLLRRKKRQHLLNIRFQQQMQIYYSQMLYSRLEWAHVRHGSFWEKDVPLMSHDMFIENFRMSRQTFLLLCSKLTTINKVDTNFRKCIPLQKRIAIALYCLNSSCKYASIAHMFGVSKSSVSHILKEFCIEVWKALSKEYLSLNFITDAKIKECVNGFKTLGFPQCFGAIDIHHFEINPPSSKTSDYYNDKGWYSIILLAVVDFRCRFLYINVGCPGGYNDSYIFERSVLKEQIQDPLFHQQAEFYDGVKVPVLLIGDSAFRLSEFMMKPYPLHVNTSEKEQQFNYTLSKCHIVAENAFCQLKARFQRLGNGIDNKIDNVNALIKCCCVLHNFLNDNNEVFNDTWQNNCDASDQPNFEELTYDYDTKCEEIRNAIANFLFKS